MDEREIEKRHRAVRQYLEEDPTQSVHMIAKRLNNDFGNPLQPGEIADIRAEYLRGFGSPLNGPALSKGLVLGEARKLHAPKCARCKGPHWISQCDQPPAVIPDVIALQNPDVIVLNEIFEPKEKPAMMDPDTKEALERAGAEQRTRAEVIVTAPHPEARRKTIAGMMMRRQYLNELLDADPGADPAKLVGLIRERFGIGLHWEYVYDTCRVARELHQLPTIEQHGPRVSPRAGGVQNPLPKFEPDPDLEFADNPDDECRWLAQQANDVMRAHQLTELRLVVENGKAKWVYKVVKTGEGEVVL